jgi:broad specificity phosphatase PhoE
MMTSTTLETILVRHGQTQANFKGIVQGQSDTRLTEEGIASTLRKAEKIRHFSFEAAFCSDLTRAADTFGILKQAVPSLPNAIHSPEIREIEFGALSGRPKGEIMGAMLKRVANPQLRYPAGESGGELTARVTKFFKMLLKSHPGQTILIVSHYGVMETAARQFAGRPPDERIVIGGDDVWRMRFNSGTSAVLTIL